MREWVIPFLLSRQDPRISEDEYLREVSVPVFCFRRLGSFFNINFSSNLRLIELFGSTLADLSSEVFLQLLGIRNLFFSYNSGLAFVQSFSLAEFPREAVLCSFSSELLRLNDSCVRGAIVHELGHVVLSHYAAKVQEMQRGGALEDEADQKCYEWGFEFEISAVREYLKSKSQI